MEVSNLPRSSYYYHIKRLDKPDKYEQVKKDILRIFRDENKCRRGYRTITDELRKTVNINHKTVQKLMKEMGLFCMVRAKKYRSYKGNIGKVAPNILDRNFKADKPFEKWVTDVTEFSLYGKKLYLSAVLDLYNSEIISYTLCEKPKYSLVSTMLDDAVSKLPQEHNLLIHSDQGWQYQMKQYQHCLRANGITQSMSRKGNCLDNSVMENFFGILKSELLYIQRFSSIEHFINELHDYIFYYNYRRTKRKLNKMSPVDYRTHFVSVA